MLFRSAVSSGVVPGRDSAAETDWQKWTEFCNAHAIDPLLSGVDDPIVVLQIFAHRYRSGLYAPRGKPVQARTVEGALRSIGQTFTSMGANDPRLAPNGRTQFRLQRQLASYSRQDPPPIRVKPIPIRILLSILAQSHASNNPHTKAIGDMIALAFFFLLRPGEYTSSSTTTPFTLGDTQLFIGRTRIDLANAPDTDIAAATFASLTFTTQKNGVRGEVVGLGRSGRYFACPVLALANRVLHLRQCQAPPNTPLASYFDGTQIGRAHV